MQTCYPHVQNDPVAKRARRSAQKAEDAGGGKWSEPVGFPDRSDPRDRAATHANRDAVPSLEASTDKGGRVQCACGAGGAAAFVIVVDASAAIDVLLQTEQSGALTERLLDEGET